MVHKNYKWNISKIKGEETLEQIITSILKGNINNIIEMDELSFLINSRNKDMIIKNNNKKEYDEFCKKCIRWINFLCRIK